MKGIHNVSVIVAVLSFVLLFSCSTHTPFYIDKKKQAIISCNGTGFKRIEIESNYEKITLEGTPFAIKFNDTVNASSISIHDTIVTSYRLILRANCSYKASADVGYDRGPFRVLFKTDSLGHVVEASNETCE